MFPWVLLWMPQFHFPFSGAVAQQIEPDLNWFFSAIPGWAGSGVMEQDIFKTVSYGTQLGALTEALLALNQQVQSLAAAQPVPLAPALHPVEPDSPPTLQAVERVQAMQQQIDAVKRRHKKTATNL